MLFQEKYDGALRHIKKVIFVKAKGMEFPIPLFLLYSSSEIALTGQESFASSQHPALQSSAIT